ncbi:MAG TPA: hypothetical protein VK031_00140 [Tissierellaceae bacterium]|nr:hypothetical protein [Tissierellaceae bacterium]
MNCKDVYKPEYSTKEDCEIVSSDCISFPEDIPYLGISKGESLTEVINKLYEAVRDSRKRITELENQEQNE